MKQSRCYGSCLRVRADGDGIDIWFLSVMFSGLQKHMTAEKSHDLSIVIDDRSCLLAMQMGVRLSRAKCNCKHAY